MILGTFGVCVIERVGLDLHRLIHENPILKQYSNTIHIIPQTITNSISSTAVRQLINKNLSVKYLMPDPVIHYIQQHGLYGFNTQIHHQRIEQYVQLEK
jgi:nicotinamide mononucleotide adenylyltransferase